MVIFNNLTLPVRYKYSYVTVDFIYSIETNATSNPSETFGILINTADNYFTPQGVIA